MTLPGWLLEVDVRRWLERFLGQGLTLTAVSKESEVGARGRGAIVVLAPVPVLSSDVLLLVGVSSQPVGRDSLWTSPSQPVSSDASQSPSCPEPTLRRMRRA